MLRFKRTDMRAWHKIFGLLAAFLIACVPTHAQLSPSEPDPLARIRDAAKLNAPACSATGETLCEQVAPKIIANAQGESPITENVRGLALDLNGAKLLTPDVVTARAVAMFHASGLEAHVEKNPIPGDGQVQDAVIVELRGREKPEEWVLVGANFDLNRGEWIRMSCNVSLVVEAARDIRLTGIKARRSIRFVILVSSDKDYLRLGSWPYVHAHRDELDRARAVIYFADGADRIGLYDLNGRKDIEAGFREATKPMESWRIRSYVDGGESILHDEFDFLLEGVPTIHANQHSTHVQVGPIDFPAELSQVDIQELKRNTAIAAVTAFGIAELSEPLGPRQSRAEIETLLKSSRLEGQMNTAGVWPLWESGQRGRVP